MNSNSYWILKFDPHIITIDDMRISNSLIKLNSNYMYHINCLDKNFIVFLNNNNNKLEALGEIKDFKNQYELMINITHKPRQPLNFDKILLYLPTNFIKAFISLDLFEILKLNEDEFNTIIFEWWGVKKYSSELTVT